MATGEARALVIGAGIGGLCAATHLARAGWSVEVLEKNRHPGGRCSSFERDGHRFDTGPTLFVLPELYRAELGALGVRMEDAFRLMRVDPTYRLVFDDGATLDLTSDAACLREQLEAAEPGSWTGFERYMEEAKHHYECAIEGLVRRDFRSIRDLVTPEGMHALRTLHLLDRHWHRAARSFRTDRLRAAFTFQDLYMGMSPMQAPATFSLLPWSELRHGVWYPEGGMSRVVDVLVDAARSAGVRIRTRCAVSALETDGDRVSEVRCEDGGVRRPDVVLANADLPYVRARLLPEDEGRPVEEGARFSSSCVSFFWGVRGTIDALRPHTLFLTDDFAPGLAEIEAGVAIPDRPCFYVHAPARIDPGMAPPDAETLVVIVPVANMGTADAADWSRVRALARRAVLDGFRRLGVGDLEDRIRFEVSYVPPSWRRRYNLAHGAAHGLGHGLSQLGALRPKHRHPRLRNLYFAGASTHPGSGVPTAMVSGRLAAEWIVGDHGRVAGRARREGRGAARL